jgi:formyl-CoA transferase
MTERAKLPLEGVRVLEFSNFIAAAIAGHTLADFGAEVWKLEIPGQLDSNRLATPPEKEDPQRSPYFHVVGRNKRSGTIDVRTEAGRELFLRLVARSQVVIENFRPGTLERWRLGFEQLRAANPDIILLRISGYGQDGPLSQEPGVDRVAQAFGGAVYLTGHPEAPPVRAGIPFADYCAGWLGALGVVMALRVVERAEGRTPAGQVVDISLYDAIAQMLGDLPIRYRLHDEVPERRGNYIPMTAPSDGYMTGDGRWVLLSAPNDALFGRLAVAVARDDWLQDPRFRDAVTRDEHRVELKADLQQWFSGRTADEAAAVLSAAGIPLSRVNTVADVLEHPHVVHRGNFVELDDPLLGRLPLPAPAPRLSATPGSIRSAAPLLGEQQAELENLLELSAEDASALRAEGVI